MKMFALTMIISAQNIFANSLKFDSIQHSQITINRDISSVYRRGDLIYETPFYGDYLVEVKYLENPKEGEYPFGDIKSDTAGTNRITFPKALKSGYWNGISSYKLGLILLEGQRKQVSLYNVEKQRFNDRTDVILDLFKPPADSRGEPTRLEVTQSRKRFVNGLIKLGGGEIVLAGINQMPEKWFSKKGVQSYLVSTRIKNYNLFRMDCSKKDGLVCILKRHCFIRGFPLKDSRNIAGIAVSSSRRLVLMGDRSKNRVLAFRWRSCHDVPYLGSLNIPGKVNKIRNLYIDDQDNLWISTEKPDNYRNASVYKWSAKDWQF